MVMPAWAEEASGLFVPTEFRRDGPLFAGPAIPGTEVEPSFGLVLRRLPSALDQMEVCVDETELGFRRSTPSRRRRWCERLHFETGTIATAFLASHLTARGWSAAAQREAADLVFARTESHRRALQCIQNGRTLFSEPHLVALLRMLVMHAGKRPTNWRFEGDAQAMLYERALASTFAFTQSGVDPQGSDQRSWLAYLTRNGAFNNRDAISGLVAQVYALFVELPRAMRSHRDYVPVEEWFQEDFDGFGVVEQFVAGILLLDRAGSLEAGPAPLALDRAVFERASIAEIAGHLRRDPRSLCEILSADREWYRVQFEGEDELTAAWNRVPFEKRPLIEMPSGRFVLSTPVALQRWMTEGLFFRAIECARRRGRESRFRQFYAAMVERYVLDLMREAHPGPRRLGVGIVRGEYQAKSGVHSPDVAVDFGPDLVLMEVVSKRLTLSTTVTADPAAVSNDLDQMIAKKMRQLSGRITDLHRSRSTIPGVDMTTVDRVWPIIVVPGGILQTPHLWAFLRAQAPGCFGQPGTQHPTILDLSDIELLAGLVEAGYCLPDLLRMKLEGYDKRDLASFVSEDYRVSRPFRSTGILRRMDALWDLAFEALGSHPTREQRDHAAATARQNAA